MPQTKVGKLDAQPIRLCGLSNTSSRNGTISALESAACCLFAICSDAKRPCSTCVRSHAYAVAHTPKGVTIPSHFDCTFDDGKLSW